jgi:hypothetical protein
MKFMKEKETQQFKDRNGERGAAMVMILLISTLMLIASIGLLLETTMNTANVTDATAEQQAYNAAESGIQSTLNVLRGKSKYQQDTGDKIDFRKAVTPATSNIAGEENMPARLSRWMTYDATHSDRIPFGLTGTNAYIPNSGYAYAVTIIDPDNQGNIITFNTSGEISNSSSAYRYPATGSDYVEIEYTPRSSTTVNATAGAASTDFGSFTIRKGGTTGAILPADIRFEIYLNMTTPSATGTLRGFIRKGTSLAVPVASIEFDSKQYLIRGSTVTLNSKSITPSILSLLGVSATTISGTMTATEPSRVMVTSTGYGPRGAVKKLETFVQKNFLDGLGAPATLTLIGPPGPGFVFEPGNSARVTYSGQDVVEPDIIIPPVGTSNDANYDIVKTALDALEKKPGQIVGEPANVTPEMPAWLQNTLNLDTVVQSFRDVAIASPGSYYASGEQPTSFGDYNKFEGITFIDGDVDLNKNGGGILVCTGKLTFHGGVNFRGLIIVTGEGGFYRTGGGGGTIEGNVVIAPYNPSNLNAGFSSPKYGITGGGNSEITYNSNYAANGLVAISNLALGIAEK